MKSEHDKRGERKARWKHFKRGKYPGAGCIRGKDQHGYAVCEVIPAKAFDDFFPHTTQQAFRQITSLVLPPQSITLPGTIREVRLSATLKVCSVPKSP